MATKTTRNGASMSNPTTTNPATEPPGVWLPAALMLWNVRQSAEFANRPAR